MAARPSDERVDARIAYLRHDGVKPRHHLIGRVPGDVLAERRAVHLASGAAGAAGQAVHLGEQVIGHTHGRLHTREYDRGSRIGQRWDRGEAGVARPWVPTHGRPSAHRALDNAYRGRMNDAADPIATFRALHERDCFVMPNPWDVGSALALTRLGFPAVATTSAGFAWSLGRPDGGITLDQALAHCREIAAAVAVPVNADFEGGFAVEPEGVAASVTRAAATGIAGLSIEDSTGDPAGPLFDFDLAVERVRAARAALDASGSGVLLTGRSEGFLVGRPDLAETVRRLTAYAEAGAECLYAPGLHSLDDITTVVRAVAPLPVNVLAGSGFSTVARLADIGVRRISVGGALARTAWTGFLRAASAIATEGTFTALDGGVAFAEINGSFRDRT